MNGLPRIAVLLKQVPHPDYFDRIAIDPEKLVIRREGIPTATNPLDKVALEVALRARETLPRGTEVHAFSMGPPAARETLDEALAMGADQGFLLCDRAFAGADTLATAKALATALSRFGHYSLIAAGAETVDGGTGQVPPQVAEFLGVAHVTSAISLSVKACSGGGWCAVVDRRVERGRLSLKVKLPAVISFGRGAAEPRIPSALDVVRGARKPVKVLTLRELGLLPEDVGLAGSPTRVIGLSEVGRARRAGGEVFSGKASEAVSVALKRLKELGAL